MIAFFTSILEWLIQRLFAQPRAPSPEAVQAAAAAQASTAEKVAVVTASAEASIAQAEADAPRSQDDVVQSLNRGTF